MKKLIPFVGIILLFFCSCSKENTFNEANNISESSKSLISEIKSLPTIQAQKIAYRQLNKDEKYYLWTTHMKKFLTGPNLNQTQKNIVHEFLNNMNPDIFDVGKFDIFINSDKMARLAYIAKNEFSKKLLTLVFSSLNDNVELNLAEEGIKNCKCNTDDDWCGYTRRCYWSYNVFCIEQTSGCGWWWNKPCNGFCAQ